MISIKLGVAGVSLPGAAIVNVIKSDKGPGDLCSHAQA